MGLLEQMRAVEALVRDPGRWPELSGQADEDAQVLRTIDPQRLEAVALTFANLVLGRWWRPRFPATFQAVADPLGLARRLVASPWFEQADGEDLTGVVLVQGLLDALEAGLEAADHTRDMLAYEYLLEVGLPRRGRGEPVDVAAEARLLGEQVTWLRGGRLALPAVSCRFEHPVSALRAGDGEAPAPDGLLFLIDADGATELEVAGVVLHALEQLAQGASDEALEEALGEDAGELLAWLRELGVLRA